MFCFLPLVFFDDLIDALQLDRDVPKGDRTPIELGDPEAVQVCNIMHGYFNPDLWHTTDGMKEDFNAMPLCLKRLSLKNSDGERVTAASIFRNCQAVVAKRPGAEIIPFPASQVA